MYTASTVCTWCFSVAEPELLDPKLSFRIIIFWSRAEARMLISTCINMVPVP